MHERVALLGAGTGPANNLIRSLRAGDPSVIVVGCHADRFVLKQSTAERNYLIPRSDHPGFVDGVRRVVETERIDLLIPTTDGDVRLLSTTREQIPCRTFLPRAEIIAVCQDKFRLTTLLRERGLSVPLTYAVSDVDRIDELFDALAPCPDGLWCRLRVGQGALGALRVRSPEQAAAWIGFWEEMRGVPATSFTLSEYLPGRDFLCQSLWKDGSLVLANTFERLSYFGGENSPSGVSSLSSLAKTVADPRLVDVCRRAIETVAPGTSGAFSIDLKENRQGVPCITEINAGRFFIGMTAFSHVGKHNMPAIFVRLACGEPVALREEYDAVEGYYLVRDLDNPPGVFQEDELFNAVRVL